VNINSMKHFASNKKGKFVGGGGEPGGVGEPLMGGVKNLDCEGCFKRVKRGLNTGGAVLKHLGITVGNPDKGAT